MGLKRLRDLDVSTTRPDDYFAEMVKTDEHMQRVCWSCVGHVMIPCNSSRALTSAAVLPTAFTICI